MSKKTYLWHLTFISTILLLAQNATVSLAQSRGRSSGDFFDRGSQRMEREIQNLQTPPPQPDFKKQGSDLNLHQSQDEDPEGKQTSAPDPAHNRDNVPTSPDDEFEFKF